MLLFEVLLRRDTRSFSHVMGVGGGGGKKFYPVFPLPPHNY